MQLNWSTLAIQTINALILVWILARFFFRPVADILAKRQAAAKALLDDAKADRAAAASAKAEADKALGDVDAQRQRLLDEARAAAETTKADLVEKARGEADKRRQEAEALIAQERAAADQAILASAGKLSVDIARRLLGRLPPASVQAAFVDALGEALAKQAPVDGTKEDVEVVSAVPLTKAQADRVRAAVDKAFGEGTPCRFTTDEALIAGVELHGVNLIILNSWRADLEAMDKELSGDGRPGQA
ncbi:F0F1 ATP synthase subunit delta [Phenylobacterium sp.]|uniref:F0F1 ATP synthase subunit delta n=1 Tax=Phenylobacterium sp. TaxID=1871053 RepID=UPI0035B42FE5